MSADGEEIVVRGRPHATPATIATDVASEVGTKPTSDAHALVREILMPAD
jgi:hypothetical protein